jgi:hypothetical protein
LVSGDTNILTGAPLSAGNLQFLSNLAGGGQVVIHPGQFEGLAVSDLTAALGGAGISYVVLDFASPVLAADLSGAGLYIGLKRSVGWTAAESQLLRQFASGARNILATGDNSFFSAENALVTALAASLGSDVAIVDDSIDEGVRHPAQILAANAFTLGTEGFDYVSTSRVTGGTALYGTEDEGIPFVAFSEIAIPEPSTWALLIAGFGLAGATLRRRGRAAQSMIAE